MKGRDGGHTGIHLYTFFPLPSHFFFFLHGRPRWREERKEEGGRGDEAEENRRKGGRGRGERWVHIVKGDWFLLHIFVFIYYFFYLSNLSLLYSYFALFLLILYFWPSFLLTLNLPILLSFISHSLSLFPSCSSFTSSHFLPFLYLTLYYPPPPIPLCFLTFLPSIHPLPFSPSSYQHSQKALLPPCSYPSPPTSLPERGDYKREIKRSSTSTFRLCYFLSLYNTVKGYNDEYVDISWIQRRKDAEEERILLLFHLYTNGNNLRCGNNGKCDDKVRVERKEGVMPKGNIEGRKEGGQEGNKE